jgi:hypothetical protein
VPAKKHLHSRGYLGGADGRVLGDRLAQVKDQFGNHWSIATHKQDVSPQELQKRAEAAMNQQRH